MPHISLAVGDRPPPTGGGGGGGGGRAGNKLVKRGAVTDLRACVNANTRSRRTSDEIKSKAF